MAPCWAARLISSARCCKVRIVREGVDEDLGIAENDGQQIVEVVRDAAGELPDGLHLLRLAQLLLGPALVGDVGGHRTYCRRGPGQQEIHELEIMHRTVVERDAFRMPNRLTGIHHLASARVHLLDRAAGKDLYRGLAQDVFGTHTLPFAEAFIDEKIATLGIRQRNRQRRMVGHHAQARLCLAQRGLGLRRIFPASSWLCNSRRRAFCSQWSNPPIKATAMTNQSPRHRRSATTSRESRPVRGRRATPDRDNRTERYKTGNAGCRRSG